MGLNFHLFPHVVKGMHYHGTFYVIYMLDYDKRGVEKTETRTMKVYTTFDKLTSVEGFALQKYISTMRL